MLYKELFTFSTDFSTSKKASIYNAFRRLWQKLSHPSFCILRKSATPVFIYIIRFLFSLGVPIFFYHSYTWRFVQKNDCPKGQSFVF